MKQFLDLTGLQQFWQKVKQWAEGKFATLDGGKLTLSQMPDLKTINSQSLIGQGDITIDLSLYKVVASLPDSDIDENKIYLVDESAEGEQNRYTEYMYVEGQWEKVGEFKADVDLTPYVKFTDVATTSKAGAMSAEDKTKLDQLEAAEAIPTEDIEALFA